MKNLKQQTKEILSDFVETSFESVAIEIESNRGSINENINGNTKHLAASLLKIPLAMAVEKQIQVGCLNPNLKVKISDLLSLSLQNSILHSLINTKTLTLGEILNLSLASSDEGSTKFLRTLIDYKEIAKLLISIGCHDTEFDNYEKLLSVGGRTTALDSLRIIKFGTDQIKFPIVSTGLKYSILNSRIPIGVKEDLFEISHKTGTLTGVAHDVAQLKGVNGIMRLAFLTSKQTDLIVSGLKMGLCTNKLISIWNLSITKTTSFL